jgi:hypothetical protein
VAQLEFPSLIFVVMPVVRPQWTPVATLKRLSEKENIFSHRGQRNQNTQTTNSVVASDSAANQERRCGSDCFGPIT